MKQLNQVVKGVSRSLDQLAGLCIFGVMLLIVSNIVLRTVFNQPILGTYELVGFITAIGVSLALAHCAFQNGHIAVSFIMERCPSKLQSLVSVLVYGISLTLWAASAWYLGKFGLAMKLKGLVSSSAEIPVYPFIYLVAFGLLGLCFVLLFKLLISMKEIFTPDTAKKVEQ